ncbi:MAG: VOC family protein [Dehalococcoidia bacterium]|nr:VOC family protein [Dehalococcoidia bacterium]
MTPLAVDHVILATADIHATATRLERDHGLVSLPGGRHAGHGTGNRIVPLGDSYIEIMGIVDEDEAAASPMGAWLREQTADGDRVAALCLRTDASGLDATAERLGLRPLPMSRDAPGGITLSWRLAGLAEAMANPSRTFFIDWQVPPDLHPARGDARHRVRPTGFAWVELAGGADAIRAWLGEDVPGVRVVAAPGPSVRATVALAGGGEVRLD